MFDRVTMVAINKYLAPQRRALTLNLAIAYVDRTLHLASDCEPDLGIKLGC